eukprot:m.26842 g.26842  ORF g.26842 m.26842 type:complete len:439 (+) comp7839_c0_seq2:134-1450(+)
MANIVLLLILNSLLPLVGGKNDINLKLVEEGKALYKLKKYRDSVGVFNKVFPNNKFPGAKDVWNMHAGVDSDRKVRLAEPLADCMLVYARSLAKIKDYKSAGKILKHIEKIVKAGEGILPPAVRSLGLASMAAEMATVIACAGDANKAVNKMEDALLHIDPLLDTPSDGSVPKDQDPKLLFATYSAELARFLLWAGATEDAYEVMKMAVKWGRWKNDLQLPAGQYIPTLEAKPVHIKSSDDKNVDSRLTPFIEALRLIESYTGALKEEANILLEAKDVLLEQNECLHTGTTQKTGAWRYAPVYGLHSTFQALPNFCHEATPEACKLVKELQSIRGISLERLGYSSIDANVHIQPHWGPTNTRLKVHLGIIIPTTTDGSSCSSMTLAGQEMIWAESKAFLFDDSFLHEVWNNCSATRLILQAVFKHPDMKDSKRDSADL